MKTNYLLLCLFISFLTYSQSNIDKVVGEAEKNICDCTKISLIKNGVDVPKLVEISNLYKTKKSIPNSYTPIIQNLYKQIKSNIKAISTDVNICRENFKTNPKFQTYFKNKSFKDKLEIALDFNNYYYGPKLIIQLAKK